MDTGRGEKEWERVLLRARAKEALPDQRVLRFCSDGPYCCLQALTNSNGHLILAMISHEGVQNQIREHIFQFHCKKAHEKMLLLYIKTTWMRMIKIVHPNPDIPRTKKRGRFED